MQLYGGTEGITQKKPSKRILQFPTTYTRAFAHVKHLHSKIGKLYLETKFFRRELVHFSIKY